MLLRVYKCLSVLSNLVGCIQRVSNGKGGSAAYFVLQGKYILICYNLVSLIAGPGIERKDWPSITNCSVWVTFSYEDEHAPENSWLEVAPLFEI